MKKLVIIFVILLFFISDNYGQGNNKFSFQFDIGTTITIPYASKVELRTLLPINGSYKTSYKTGFGYFTEMFTNYNFNKNVSITTGLNYSYISYKIIDGEVVISEGKLNNSYLDIPLLVNYKFSEKIPISISAGTYFGFLLFAQEKGTTYIDTSNLVVTDPNDPLLQPSNYNNNIKKAYFPNDYGVLFRVEYEINFYEKISGVLLSRFNYGLKNVLKSGTMHSAAYEWRNYNVLIGIGLKIK